jgi:hypothetical protein
MDEAMLALRVLDNVGSVGCPLSAPHGAHGLRRGRSDGKRPGPQRRSAAIFRRRVDTQRGNADLPALHRETK